MKIQLSILLMLSLMSMSACAADNTNFIKKSQSSSASESQKMNRVAQIAHCKRDMAERLGVNENDINLIKAESVTWRSGALGCPSPGKHYTQALTPGVLIVLEVDNKASRYHAALNSTPFLCPGSRFKAPPQRLKDR